MYAFVVMALINGSPQVFIMERGLSASQCETMVTQPDNGLRIDGQPISGESRCVPESDLPSDSDTAL